MIYLYVSINPWVAVERVADYVHVLHVTVASWCVNDPVTQPVEHPQQAPCFGSTQHWRWRTKSCCNLDWSNVKGMTNPPLETNYPAWKTYKKLLTIAIEIVDLPIKHGDFP